MSAYERGLEISPELLEIEIYYSIAQFPSPYAPMSYGIRINDEGELTLEYRNVDMYENYSNTTVQLTESDIVGLIDCVQKNNFFRLAENLDGRTNITDQPARYLAVTYDGETHECRGYNTTNKRFLAICGYIESLAR